MIVQYVNMCMVHIIMVAVATIVRLSGHKTSLVHVKALYIIGGIDPDFLLRENFLPNKFAICHGDSRRIRTMKRRWTRVIITPRCIHGILPDSTCNIVVRGETGRCEKLTYFKTVSRILWRMASVGHGGKVILHWRYAKS